MTRKIWKMSCCLTWDNFAFIMAVLYYNVIRYQNEIHLHLIIAESDQRMYMGSKLENYLFSWGVPVHSMCWVDNRRSNNAISKLRNSSAWWRHQMETFSALLTICAGNSPVTGEFPAQRPVTRSFDVFFDLRLTERLSKQSWGWWFETPSYPLCRHSNGRQKHGLEYYVLVVIGLFYVKFILATRIFHRGVPGFALRMNVPAVFGARGLTTCLLYVGPHLEVAL